MDSLRHDLREITGIAANHGRALADIGESTRDAVFELGGGGSPDELQACATRLRGAVTHGLLMLAELCAQAGRLEQIASVRRGATEPS